MADLAEFRDLADIQSLIRDGIDESLTLEYKRELGDNHEMAKDISALANTLGGTLIYGIECEGRSPKRIRWIPHDGTEERIQNVIASYVQPRLEGVTVFRISDPASEHQAIFVVEVPQSPRAPHMVRHMFYTRRGSTSSPMDHNEVVRAMFGVGRTTALHAEVSANLDLIETTRHFIDRIFDIPSDQRGPLHFVPFNTDAWYAIIGSGFLFVFPDHIAAQLVESYRVIHEVNTAVDWMTRNPEVKHVHTPVYKDSYTNPIYITQVLRDGLNRMKKPLEEVISWLNQNM